MAGNLHYNAVSHELLRILKILMATEEFKDLRLAGVTALSLYRGHRESLDIDMFTDVRYGSIDLDAIDQFLRSTFSYTDTSEYFTLA